MMNKLYYLIAIVLCFSCTSESPKEETSEELLKVVSVNYPLHYFADRIAGGFIQLDYPIPSEVDPAYWIPQDSALNIYQNADVILTNGADYAKWMEQVSLPSSRIVNTSASMSDQLIEVQTGASHSHGAGGEHVHTGFAFTTWLNFEMAQLQAQAVKDILKQKLPKHQEVIESNYTQLKGELIQMHMQMKTIGKQLHDEGIIGSHPVYQYLAEAYHLHINSVHFEPGEMPSHDQWHDFEHELGHHPAKMMLWEDEPLQEIRTKVEQKNLQIVVFNPCGNKPSEGDFISVMQHNIASLKAVVK